MGECLRGEAEHALIMPPQLFHVQQVLALNNWVHMAPGRGPQLCFDVEKANINEYFTLPFLYIEAYPGFTIPPVEQELCDNGSSAQTEHRFGRRDADVWQLFGPCICPPGPSTS